MASERAAHKFTRTRHFKALAALLRAAATPSFWPPGRAPQRALDGGVSGCKPAELGHGPAGAPLRMRYVGPARPMLHLGGCAAFSDRDFQAPRSKTPADRHRKERASATGRSRSGGGATFALDRFPGCGGRMTIAGSSQMRSAPGPFRSSAEEARKQRKRKEMFRQRNERFRDGGRKSLKSLGREISDFAELFVFNALTAF